LARPKLRGASEAFASRLFGSHVTKTNVLESLVIASFIRGLPVRDVEATLAEALGDQAAIAKSTVSAICGQITGEYQAWAWRRLDGISWTTCSWTPASSACTRTRRPSRCWPPVIVGKGVAKPAWLATGLGPFLSQSRGVTAPPPVAPKPSATSPR
jgi:putative transposase